MDQRETVSTKQLGAYLNDHLAGSVAALEMVAYLAKNYPDTTLEQFFAHPHALFLRNQATLPC